MFTPSRAFKIQSGGLAPVTLKQGEYYTPIDHPVIVALEPMTPDQKLQASTELLNSLGVKFWENIPEVSPEHTDLSKSVKVSKSFKKVPKEDWIRLIKFFSYFCLHTQDSRELEALTLLVLNNETKELRLLVPKQVVTKVSAGWSILDENVPLYFLNGTELKSSEFKANWTLVGIVHSHNTMGAFPSSVDDEYEIRDSKGVKPTGVHMIVGSLNTFSSYETVEPYYSVYPSISHLGHRIKLEGIENLVEPYSSYDWKQFTFSTRLFLAVTVETKVEPQKKLGKKKIEKTPISIELEKNKLTGALDTLYFGELKSPEEIMSLVEEYLSQYEDLPSPNGPFYYEI